MRRRRNQANSRDRVPQARDHIVNFVAGELAAFTRLRALRHLDLKFVGVDQVIGSDAEARRSHLLNRTAPPVAVRVFLVALFVFAAFTGVRLPADAVHGDG